jgi:hypothetical protein
VIESRVETDSPVRRTRFAWCAWLAVVHGACALPEVRLIEPSLDAGSTNTSNSSSAAQAETGSAARTTPDAMRMSAGASGDVSAMASGGAGSFGGASGAAPLGGIGGMSGVESQPQTPDAGRRAALPLGASCKRSNECGSSVCLDGVCCAWATCLSCQRCGSNGQCEPVTNAPDDGCPNGTCNLDGKCVLRKGEKCSEAADCEDNNCVDGVCCEMVCSGGCSACDVARREGFCVPITGVDNPKACTGQRSCFNGRCADITQQAAATAASGIVAIGGSSPTKKIAQTLTISASGELLDVRLALACRAESVQQLTAAVWSVDSNGGPTSPVLVQLRTDMPHTERTHTTPSDESWMSLPARDSLMLKSGDRIAIVLDATRVTQDDCVVTRGMYAGAGEWTSAGGDTWSAENDSALAFKILVGQ